MNRSYAAASALDSMRHIMWSWAAYLTGNLGTLVSGYWTLYASSDSVTSGTDATDRWVLLGPYDGTKLVRAAEGVAHSWIVLKSPTTYGGSYYYLILSLGSAADTAVRISVSKTAPTAGSTTATPGATDQWWPGNGSRAAVDSTICANAVDITRTSIGLATDGSFWFATVKSGAGLVNGMHMFNVLADSNAADLYPVILHTDYVATGAARQNSYFFGGSSSTGIGMASLHPTNGTPIYSANSTLLPFMSSGGGGSLILNLAAADVLSSKYIDWPIYVFSGTNVTATSLRGRIADFAYCPHSIATLAEGSVAPAVGGVDSTRIGNLWVPANAAITL